MRRARGGAAIGDPPRDQAGRPTQLLRAPGDRRVVSPVLTLPGEAGRLFKPLAYAKSLAMIVAAVLAVTLDPALRLMFTRVTTFRFRPRWLAAAANALLVGTIHPERSHPVNRWIMGWYEPAVAWSLRNKRILFGGVAVLMAGAVPLWISLGTEFMPPLDEGTLLYMPSTMPGISISEAERLLQVTDRTLAQFPRSSACSGRPAARTPPRTRHRCRCSRP